MPNWCDNTVTIVAPQDVIDGLVLELEREDGCQLLEHMVPLGEWDYEKSVENWGTKWDVTPHSWDRNGDCEITISFDSAWSPPLKAYETFLDKIDDDNVSLKAYYHEPGMCFAGYYENGIDEYYEWDSPKDMKETVPEFLRDFYDLDTWYDEWENEEDDVA